ncbi:uncharacterized protein BJ171DRAFT_493023 [Polychytrium aggregatum]|uniref:uncharacterized protein n=1 Tax=Polychytrium aggregatum TaxID=110093 RepID=UPI0022FF4524|nr:uncharacterized protein BJ171DRAFT_493023 [Polychytrium aggregatum]KAI9207562.1 hypothetical protein BJ171DRAFT_493023 [Polychytrium aggregatum]
MHPQRTREPQADTHTSKSHAESSSDPGPPANGIGTFPLLQIFLLDGMEGLVSLPILAKLAVLNSVFHQHISGSPIYQHLWRNAILKHLQGRSTIVFYNSHIRFWFALGRQPDTHSWPVICAPSALDRLASAGLSHALCIQLEDVHLSSLSGIPFRRSLRISDLRLSGNFLDSVPSETLEELPQLQKLNLSKNTLTSLPSTLGLLIHLKELNLSQNQLTYLPEEIGCLTKLEVLNVSNNCLSSLPQSLGCLESLQSLDLAASRSVPLQGRRGSSNAHVSSWIPDSLGALRSLRHLDLSSNRLGHLPTALCALSSLLVLSIRSNLIESLPDSIGRLRDLCTLDASMNRLSTLPNEIGRLGNLEELDLAHNQLHALPSSLGQLAALTYLDVSSNRIKSLPSELRNLHGLEIVYAHNNQLSPGTATSQPFSVIL